MNIVGFICLNVFFIFDMLSVYLVVKIVVLVKIVGKLFFMKSNCWVIFWILRIDVVENCIKKIFVWCILCSYILEYCDNNFDWYLISKIILDLVWESFESVKVFFVVLEWKWSVFLVVLLGVCVFMNEEIEWRI